MKHLTTYKLFEGIEEAKAAVDAIESNITEVCDTLVDVFDKYNIHEHIPYTGNVPLRYTQDPNNHPPEESIYWQYDLNFDWTTGTPHRYATDKVPKKYFKYAIEVCNIPNEYNSSDLFKNILRDIKALKPIVRARTGGAIRISHETVSGYSYTHKIRIDLSDRNRNILRYNSFIHTLNDPYNQNPDNYKKGIV